ncbi:MAG: hypothetical protein HOI15_16615 [Opitutales bacterium]|nr:hypothetical protein [Opitutales bacterium]
MSLSLGTELLRDDSKWLRVRRRYLRSQKIMDLVVLSDQTSNEREYEVYKELFAPGYYSMDK